MKTAVDDITVERELSADIGTWWTFILTSLNEDIPQSRYEQPHKNLILSKGYRQRNDPNNLGVKDRSEISKPS